jgi:hypothetical protein
MLTAEFLSCCSYEHTLLCALQDVDAKAAVKAAGTSDRSQKVKESVTDLAKLL